MDAKYAKYLLNHRLLLKDGFFTYYLQRKYQPIEEVLDVQVLVFDWFEDTEKWLINCARYDHFATFNKLRRFLSRDNVPFGLHLMDDRQVLLKAADCIKRERGLIVIHPNHGWAVKTDPHTCATTIPIVVEAAPDPDGLLNELKHELNALVAEQQKKYHESERLLAENNDFLEYGKAVGGGLYDFTVGTATSAIDTIKAATTVMRTLDNLAASFKTAAAASLYYGTLNPLKKEIDAIVKPVAATYEQALEYKAVITTLFNDEETAELLTDFAKRYYKVTHRLELTRFGVSGSGDIILTIILAMFTLGAGAAANTALKVKRLEKVAAILLKLSKILKRIGPRYRLPKLEKKAGASAKHAATLAAEKKKGIPEIERTQKKSITDGKFNRNHLDGDPKDPYTLMPDGKPMGAKEGAMPSEFKGVKKLPADYEKLRAEGYPDIETREDFANFSTIEAKELPPGTKIYRIVDEGSSEMSKGNSGCYWTKELPTSKTEWRKNFAVKDSWNDNGYYVEHTVGPDGLKVWEGKTAGQRYRKHNGKRFFLEGGETQLYIDYGIIENLQPKPTNWPDV